jgi:hypothetical protein
VKPLGGAPEVQFLSNGHEVAEMAQFHAIDMRRISIDEQTCIGRATAKTG